MTIDELRFKRVSPSKIVIEGKATPDSTVVVENKSLAPFGPVHTPDTFSEAKAGSDGKFVVELAAAREGDRVVVRGEGKAGAVHLRVKNVEAVDGRAPVIRQQGLRLVADGDGFRFSQVCKSTVIGEPLQQLRMTNARTENQQLFTLDDEGALPNDARLIGAAGDVWQVATSDGAHNTHFSNICSALVAPSSGEPRAHRTGVTLHEVTGPLFASGSPAPGTVTQGQIGDCWLVSGVDAILARKPEIVRNMMKDNGDGTVTVTFKRFDHARALYVDEKVTVTRQIYVRQGFTAPYYGSSTTGDAWFPLLEKAYAVWKGGYDGARSGYPFEAFEALLGAEGRHFDLDVTSVDALWRALSSRSARGEAIAAWTRVDSKDLPFANSGLAGDHAYAVLGVEEVDGERRVIVRNPWGSNGWSANASALRMQSRPNGVLSMPVDVFAKYYAGVGAVAT